MKRSGRVAFWIFIAIETALIALTIWDIGRFNGLIENIATTATTDASQLEAARISGWILVATFGQLLVATVGFYFVGRTLRANEASVEVATRTLEAQQRTAADQHRAYVHAAAADIEWDRKHHQCRVQFAFSNTGHSPATFFEFGASFVEVPHGFRAREVAIARPDKFTRWSPIGSGDRVTAAWYESRLGDRLDAYPGPSTDAGGVILITGVVRYGTIFQETFETDFAFFLRQAPPSDGKPTKLSRSTNAFRAYELVEAVPAVAAVDS